MALCGHAHLHLMSRHDIAVLRRCCESIAVYMLSELRVPFQKHLSPSLYSLFFLLHDGTLGFIPTPPRWPRLKMIHLMYGNMDVMPLPVGHYETTSLKLVDQDLSDNSAHFKVEFS